MIGAKNYNNFGISTQHKSNDGSNSDYGTEHRAASSLVASKLKHLSQAFDKRTQAVKAELIRTSGDTFREQTALPSVGDSDEEEKKSIDLSARGAPSATPIPSQQGGKASPFLEYRPPVENVLEDEESIFWGTIRHGVIDTSTTLYRLWLLILSLTFMYNFWAITLRASFPQFATGDDGKVIGWLVMDYVCDLVVLCDIIFVKPRIAFYENGLVVYDKKVLRMAYLKSRKFRVDVIAMLPLDLCYLAVGRIEPLFRLPRLLNIRYYFEMFDRFDRSSALPEVFRMLKTIFYILMTVHLYTCVYYQFSERMGIGKDPFLFEGEPFPAYARCFFITFKMATRIGGQGKEPHTFPERGLMAVFWLIALFVEIILLAQVREIFISMTKEDDEFGLLLSTALAYVRRYKCPVEIEKKVRDWFTYTRDTQKTLDEQDVLKLLPKHLRTDLAFDIHYALLSKVSVFENCERAVLSDVVVKLKLEMFFPNDIIYRKGDVGKQMYIIEKGHAEVIDDTGAVVAVLTEGAVFGERSLLSLGANNRRHVTVRSKGYSNLFVLSKDDFQEIMVHHPKIYRRLRKKALAVPESKNAASSLAMLSEQKVADLTPAQPIVDVVEKVPRPSTPKILRLMMKILPLKSSIIRRMMKVHPSPRDERLFDADSADYDPEIAALHWSTPSPDEFYVPQEWELRHYKVRPPTPVKQEEESVFEIEAGAPSKTTTNLSTTTTTNISTSKPRHSKVSGGETSAKNVEHVSTITTLTSTDSNYSSHLSKNVSSNASTNTAKTSQSGKLHAPPVEVFVPTIKASRGNRKRSTHSQKGKGVNRSLSALT